MRNDLTLFQKGEPNFMEPSTSRAEATGVTRNELRAGPPPAVLILDDAHAEMIAQYAASLPKREGTER